VGTESWGTAREVEVALLESGVADVDTAKGKTEKDRRDDETEWAVGKRKMG